MPGQSASTCASPITPASRVVSVSSARPAGEIRPVRLSTITAAPPAIHAATTGQVPNNTSLITLSPITPTIAAGTNAIATAVTSRRPSALRPTSPSTITPRGGGRARAPPGWRRTGSRSRSSSPRRRPCPAREVEDPRGDEEVAGRADREELGDAFDHAEHHGLARCAASSRPRRARPPKPHRRRTGVPRATAP